MYIRDTIQFHLRVDLSNFIEGEFESILKPLLRAKLSLLETISYPQHKCYIINPII